MNVGVVGRCCRERERRREAKSSEEGRAATAERRGRVPQAQTAALKKLVVEIILVETVLRGLQERFAVPPKQSLLPFEP